MENPWESASGERIGRADMVRGGEGAGVGGDAIGTYSVDELSPIAVGWYGAPAPPYAGTSRL